MGIDKPLSVVCLGWLEDELLSVVTHDDVTASQDPDLHTLDLVPRGHIRDTDDASSPLQQTKTPRGRGFRERTTGFEPATLSLGS